MIPVGEKFEIPFTVDQAVYGGFVSTFKDKNPLHTVKDFAQARGFKSEVMHGNILNGFLSFFIGECLPMKNVIIHSEEIKYSKPVYLNDTVTLKAELIEKYDSVKTYIFGYSFENQDGIRVAKGKIQIGEI